MNSLPSDSDHRLEKLWSEFDTLEAHLRVSTGTTEEQQAGNVQDERNGAKVRGYLSHLFLIF